jgi:hypothetical protein
MRPREGEPRHRHAAVGAAGGTSPEEPMTTPSFEQLRAAWTSRTATARVVDTDGRYRTALRLLAEGRPVAATEIATITGEPVAEVDAWLARMATAGYELNEDGRHVGAALILRSTAHRLRVRGKDPTSNPASSHVLWRRAMWSRVSTHRRGGCRRRCSDPA